MQDKKTRNFNAIGQYTKWNKEMTDLYNKYSLVPELNNDLMRSFPVIAMYALSKYLERQRYELEAQINKRRMEIIARAGKDPVKFAEATEAADKMTYEALKPIISEYMTARTYYVVAVHKSREEFEAFAQQRDEMHSTGKAK